ncbi:MAG: Uma2 family endonuclease, partial [Gemmataceae bacterium]|nr:Uma2 family endonuclease [Gemmataceae bacterium]
MTTATAPNPPAVTPSVQTRGYSTVADLLRQLGDIPADRVRMEPTPGLATLADLIQTNERRLGPTCEWIDNTLVEKPTGLHESWLTVIIIGEICSYLDKHDVGMCSAPDGVVKILPGIGRAPDVAVFLWDSLPDGKPPAREDKVPAIVPDLVIEVLSASNTPAEMARKRDEYFRAGVKQVWEIEPESRSANVFTGPD